MGGIVQRTYKVGLVNSCELPHVTKFNLDLPAIVLVPLDP